MAGNPFRRTAAAASDKEHEGEPRIDTTSWARKDGDKRKTKKRVTIQTPPHSPEQTQRSSSGGRLSPPPSVPIANGFHESAATTTDEAELEEAVENMRRNQDSLSSQASGPDRLIGRAPYNPFARTLATSEASLGRDAVGSETPLEQRDQQAHEQGDTARQQLNVDDFKDILLHGSATPIAGRHVAPQAAQGSSSSTGTSTASRQSLFESNYDVGLGSPRTSLEHLDSPSEDEYEDDDHGDEGTTLMKGTGRLDDLAPPAPPKRAQSPATEPQGPQTVPFDEFDVSTNTSASQKSINGFGRHNRPTELRRSESDLNKPLPPPPVSHNASQGSKTQAHVSSPLVDVHASASTLEPPRASQHKKRTPPPPPVSRRKGAEPTPQSHLEPSHGPNTLAPSQVGPSQQMLLAPATSEMKSMPPPPPRRNATRTGSSADRSPSSTSQSSRRSSRTSISQTAPPAPPPRRGGSKSQTSGTNANTEGVMGNIGDSPNVRRGSGNSFTSERSTSLSNLQGVVEDSEMADDVVSPPAQSSSTKFLDDMDAFQAEIDALRAKQDKGG